MKVDPSDNSAIAAGKPDGRDKPERLDKAAGTSQAGAVRRAGQESSGEPGSATDLVRLSGLFERLRQAGGLSEADETPEQAARLERLREQVSDGSYEIDAAQIAARMVDEAGRA